MDFGEHGHSRSLHKHIAEHFSKEADIVFAQSVQDVVAVAFPRQHARQRPRRVGKQKNNEEQKQSHQETDCQSPPPSLHYGRLSKPG